MEIIKTHVQIKKQGVISRNRGKRLQAGVSELNALNSSA